MNVYSVILDGTTTNLSAVKLFRCKLGYDEGSIDGKFIFDSFTHNLYFIPDACHVI